MLVAAFSASVLVAATLLARGAPGTMGSVVSDSQTLPLAGAGLRTFVAGRILDAEGDPVAEAAVRVRSEARRGCDWVTTSRSDGSFQVDGVAPGKIEVVAQDPAAGFIESTTLDPDGAQHVVLVLDRTVELSGTVLDERGAALARAVVKFAGRRGAQDRIVVTDEEGRFTLHAAVRTGDRMTAWARGFEPTAVTLATPFADVIQQNVRLHASPSVRGTVIEPSGAPVAGVRITACPGKQAEVTTSDVAGAFALPATTIGCWASAFHPRFAGSRPMRIANGRPMVVRLGVGGAIEGSAVDEHGKPIALFSVTIASFEPEDGAAGNATRAGETAEHLRGTFRVDDLASGTYVLRLSAEGRVDAESRPIEVARGRVIRGEQLVLGAADAPASGESDSTGGMEPANDAESVAPGAPDEAAPRVESEATEG